jgi:hypothetical protein
MRTSGAGHDGFLTFMPIVAALIIVLALVGGPSSLLRTVDHWLRDLVALCVSAASALVATL